MTVECFSLPFFLEDPNFPQAPPKQRLAVPSFTTATRFLIDPTLVYERIFQFFLPSPAFATAEEAFVPPRPL